MACLAAGLRRVLRMDFVVFGRGTHFMTVCTGRFSFYVILTVYVCPVAMKLLCLVAIKAFHPLFKVYVSDPAVSSHVLRVNPPAVTGGASFILIFFLEAVVCKETLIDAGHNRCLNMTVSARGMTGSARLLKYFCVKLLGLRLGAAFMDAVA